MCTYKPCINGLDRTGMFSSMTYIQTRCSCCFYVYLYNTMFVFYLLLHICKYDIFYQTVTKTNSFLLICKHNKIGIQDTKQSAVTLANMVYICIVMYAHERVSRTSNYQLTYIIIIQLQSGVIGIIWFRFFQKLQLWPTGRPCHTVWISDGRLTGPPNWQNPKWPPFG